MIEPTFGYARALDGAYIAYSTFGEGAVDLVTQPSFFGDIDLMWEFLDWREQVSTFASFARVVTHDRRGTGLSSRNVDVPSLEIRVDDLRCVLDTIGSEQPVLLAAREDGASSALFAASDPERVRSLIWHVPQPRSLWAPDYPWGVGPAYVERDRASLDVWGTDAYADAFMETEAAGDHEVVLDGDTRRTIARLSRHTATPDVARRLMDIWYDTDIRAALPSVTTPTLLTAFEGDAIDRATTEYVAELMPGSQLVLLPGKESDGQVEPFIDAVRTFLGVERAPDLDRVLATVLFTDIVDSTAAAARMGDAAWRALIERHDGLAREVVARFRGEFVRGTGDGLLATFDGPARGVRCAQSLIEEMASMGVEIRAGLHTGEIQYGGNDLAGIGVHIGARVAAAASTSEVWVSSTVKDLVAGSGLTFEDAGEHELKGVPDRWHLYRVVSP